MPLPASRHAPEVSDGLCPVCGKPINMQDVASRKLMIDPTGEYKYTHSHCGIDHHVQTKKRLAEVVCGTCGLVFKDNHMLISGETPLCRDGREFVHAEDVPDVPSRKSA